MCLRHTISFPQLISFFPLALPTLNEIKVLFLLYLRVYGPLIEGWNVEHLVCISSFFWYYYLGGIQRVHLDCTRLYESSKKRVKKFQYRSDLTLFRKPSSSWFLSSNDRSLCFGGLSTLGASKSIIIWHSFTDPTFVLTSEVDRKFGIFAHSFMICCNVVERTVSGNET